MAPAACPAFHSLSSRTSTRTGLALSASIFLYPVMSVSFTRDLASLTSFKNPGLCAMRSPNLLHALDICAGARELFLNFLIAAIDVVHAIDHGFPARRQTGQGE